MHSISRLIYSVLLFVAIGCRDLPAAEVDAVSRSVGDTVYFYNPEANINNYVSLKTEFDNYFAGYGKWFFQPFSDKDTFEKALQEGRQGVFLLSSWHYRLLQSSLPMQPILVATSRDKSTQRKILSAKTQIARVDQLKGARIATSGNEVYTHTVIKQIIGEKNQSILDEVKLIAVPKDIDALMAVCFGIADAALTTEDSLQSLQAINPKQFGMLTRLGVSEEQFLTLAVVDKKADAVSRSLLDALQTMSKTPDGANKLKMLGLDGWKKLTQEELKELGL